MEKFNREYERVPTIHEIDKHDPVSWYRARNQFVRDRWVDRQEIRLLRERVNECVNREQVNAKKNCRELVKEYLKALTAYKETRFGGDNPRWSTLPPGWDMKDLDDIE